MINHKQARVEHSVTGFGKSVKFSSRQYSVVVGYSTLRTKSGAIRTFATRSSAQSVADEINSESYVAPGISVQSAKTELASIGPAHPDYRG